MNYNTVSMSDGDLVRLLRIICRDYEHVEISSMAGRWTIGSEAPTGFIVEAVRAARAHVGMERLQEEIWA